jgi:hypothetical protein
MMIASRELSISQFPQRREGYQCLRLHSAWRDAVLRYRSHYEPSQCFYLRKISCLSFKLVGDRDRLSRSRNGSSVIARKLPPARSMVRDLLTRAGVSSVARSAILPNAAPVSRSASGRVFLGERQPELLLILDEASQLCAVEWLELRAGFLKSLLQLRIVENLAQAVA